MQQQIQLDTQYDQSLANINKLNQLLQKIANKQSLQDLQDLTTPQDYLQLLGSLFIYPIISASLIYSLHSTMYSYSHVKCQQMPEQYKKVRQYYLKIKDTLAGKSIQKQKNPLQIDKQAALRMIKNGIKQDSTLTDNIKK